MSQQRKFFPGWLVVASGFVIMATCYTIFVNCMSLFQPLIVSDLGISLAQYNISNAISTVERYRIACHWPCCRQG